MAISTAVGTPERERNYDCPRVWQPKWRGHRKNCRQAEVLTRGLVLVLAETNNGPACEAALGTVVNAAGWAVLRFP